MAKGKRTLFMAFILIIGFLSFLPMQKGQANPDSIVYSNGLMSYSGGSEGNEINFWDLWNTSDVNGWDVVEKNENNTQFTLACKLQGNESSWFADEAVQVIFADNILDANYETFWTVKTQSHVRLGKLIDETNNITRSGVGLYSGETSFHHYLFKAQGTSETTIYGCFITWVYAFGKTCSFQTSYGKIYNSFFSSVNIRTFETNLFNIQVSDVSISYGTITDPRGNNNEIKLTKGKYAIASDAWQGYTLKDITIKNHTYIFQAYYSLDSYFIDFNSNTWAFQWTGSSQGEIYRQYSFDLTLCYPNGTYINGTETGARIILQHYGENAGVDYNATLGENGKIPTQILTKGFYNQTGEDSLYSYEPFNLHVYNITGYDEYNQNFTISQKTTWEVVLTPKRGFVSGLGIGFFLAIIIGLITALGLAVKRR